MPSQRSIAAIGFNLGVALAVTTLFSIVAKMFKSTRTKKRVVGIIPARYDSTRFPGKPLQPILGVPMILRTWAAARKATTLDALYIATDDHRIADLCHASGASVIMTSSDCPNGSERCAQAMSSLPSSFDIVVNIQGDEPLIDPCVIESVVKALIAAPDAVYSTACAVMKDLTEVPLRQRVKCVTDVNGYALYFSRGVLPHNKEGEPKVFPPPFDGTITGAGTGKGKKEGAGIGEYLLHMGVQCFDAQFLQRYVTLPPTPLMVMEDLEQLKILEHGYRMKVVIAEHACHGVDTPEDLVAVEALMLKKEVGELETEASFYLHDDDEHAKPAAKSAE